MNSSDPSTCAAVSASHFNMTWSWKLARIAGIDIYVHVTFVMVIVWIGVIYWSQNQNFGAVFRRSDSFSRSLRA